MPDVTLAADETPDDDQETALGVTPSCCPEATAGNGVKLAPPPKCDRELISTENGLRSQLGVSPPNGLDESNEDCPLLLSDGSDPDELLAS